ncbi:hypothetical protein GOV11_03630 [Candidatus Woesearchaeota archaeon]|nr:hypothetical protein [Candidatus Woesearchaeota archaeon]
MGTKPCAFCDPSKFSDRLITETENFWVFPTIGQISEGGYSLIVSKEHHKSLIAMPDNLIEEFSDLEAKVFEATRNEYYLKDGDTYGRPIGFEHGVVGQTVFHAHYHVFPSAVRGHDWWRGDLFDRVEKDLYVGIGLHNLNDLTSRDDEHYLLVTDESHFNYIFPVDNPESVPPMYLRIVAADMLGVPERANWRKIWEDEDAKAHDQKLMLETMERLKPYF